MLNRLTAGVVLAVTAVLAATSHAHDPRSGSCPANASVLAQNGVTAVVRRRAGGIVACARHERAAVLLTSEYFQTLFRSPALAVKGSRVGYAIFDSLENEEKFHFTRVLRLGLSRKGAGGMAVKPADAYQAAPLGSNVRVTRLVLRSDGAMAWIACESRFNPPSARVSEGGECSRTGRESFVVTVDAVGRRRQITSGKTIDPQYLRLARRGQLAYRKNGRRVVVPLR